MATKIVMMDNDCGGIVHVSKNQLCLRFCDGTEHTIDIDTNNLLKLIEARSEELWDTDEFVIEPFYRCPDSGALLVIITIPFVETDEDTAVVYRCDLLEVLRVVEYVV